MTEPTAEEIVEQLKKENRATADASYQKGFDAASELQDLRYWTGGQVTAGGNSERAEAAYQAELRPLIAELKEQGIRGASNLRNHPRVKELARRHGRS